jgi:serine/threonine-protein kinase HipA
MRAWSTHQPSADNNLLGLRDDSRQGALRFRDPKSSIYLADEHHGVPHLLQLPELLSAAERLERDEATEAELQTLLRGGSSLGGARPKAHVIDGTGQLAIAKFPCPSSDEWDVMRWEAVALRLAQTAGITVPTSTLRTIDGKPVLILERFDRSDHDQDLQPAAVQEMAPAFEHEQREIAQHITGSPAKRTQDPA